MKTVINNLIIILFTMVFVSCMSKDTEKSSDSDSSIIINNAWMRPGSTNRNSAAFMEIINNSGNDDTLLSVSSNLAQAVELHETFIAANDVKGMRHVNSIYIPANSTTVLKPGGYHVMLIGLNKDLTANVSDTIKFHFKNLGIIATEVITK